MAAIWWAGDDRASAATSSSLIERILSLVAPSLIETISPLQMAHLNVTIRKLGHVVVYGILALLNLWAVALRLPGRSAAALSTAFITAVLWAGVDELRQSYAVSRGGSAWDVLLDAAGACLFLLIYARRTK